MKLTEEERERCIDRFCRKKGCQNYSINYANYCHVHGRMIDIALTTRDRKLKARWDAERESE